MNPRKDSDMASDRHLEPWALVILTTIVIFPIASGLELLRLPGVLIGAFAAYILVLGALRRPELGWRIAFPLVLFTGAALISALNSSNMVSVIGRAGVFGSLVLVTASAAYRYPVKASCRWCFIWIPSGISLIALVLSLVDPSNAYLKSESGISRLSIPLVYLHPNTLGVLAVTGLVATFMYRRLFTDRSLLFVGVLAINTSVLLLSGSRSALVDLVAGAFVIGFLRRAALRRLFMFCLVVLVLLLFARNGLQGAVLRGQETSQFAKLSGRIPIWEAAGRAIRSAPVTGVGYSNGAREALEGTDISLSYSVSTSDNVFIDALLECGVLGLIAICMVAGRVARLLARSRQLVNPSVDLLVCCAVAAMVLVHSLTSSGLIRFSPLLAELVLSLVLGFRELASLSARHVFAGNHEGSAPHTHSWERL
ncbi:unannotated protein [freshwater metagenome]|uniref:Unannotated protein n=1 Tax=freshwater metagenome TaxID=449393 RepID=A0A6J6WNB1_9ZZZZ